MNSQDCAPIRRLIADIRGFGAIVGATSWHYGPKHLLRFLDPSCSSALDFLARMQLFAPIWPPPITWSRNVG